MIALYDVAKQEGVDVDFFSMKSVKAFSLPKTIIINPSLVKTLQEFRECLAHELGHQIKNAFYSINSTLETRSRQEERATRWAVAQLIPADELREAIKKGNTEIWQLAEYFDVSYKFMADTIRVHRLKGNI